MTWGNRPTPRKDAKARGDSTYVGAVCGKDATHSTVRATNNGQCVTCKLAALAKYRKTDKYKQYQKEYQAKYRNDPANKEILQRAYEKWNKKQIENRKAIDS